MTVGELKQELTDVDDDVLVLFNCSGALYGAGAVKEKEIDILEANAEGCNPEADIFNWDQQRRKVVVIQS